MVLPVLLILLLGTIDVGRYFWEVNKAEKATQMGARWAAVTEPIAGGLAVTFVGRTVGGVTLTQGDRVPAAALNRITCTKPSTTVVCSGQTGDPAVGTITGANFDAIVARMRRANPAIAASNVSVSYRGSGLGFAGDPNGMDIAPLITVELINVPFEPVTGMSLAAITLPVSRTTLTAEDSAGTVSN